MSADKTLSWSYTEDFTAEDEATAQARIRGLELGITPVSSGTGAALRMLAASVGAKSVAEVGTGTGVSGLWLLGGMGTDGVLTTIDVEPELQREARRAFDGAGYPSSRTRIIQGRASDVMPRMAARSYDMVVLDVAPEEAILLASNALRMLRPDPQPFLSSQNRASACGAAGVLDDVAPGACCASRFPGARPPRVQPGPSGTGRPCWKAVAAPRARESAASFMG